MQTLKFGLRLSPSPRKAVLRILRAGVKGVSSVAMEGDWTSGGEHAIERADVELQCCAPGIYIILLTKVTSIKKTFLKINKFWGLCNNPPPLLAKSGTLAGDPHEQSCGLSRNLLIGAEF